MSSLSTKVACQHTWNPPSVANGDEYAEAVTVPGAELGDYVFVTSSADVFDMLMTATVTAADTVTVVVSASGGAVDLPGSTLRIAVVDKAVMFLA